MAVMSLANTRREEASPPHRAVSPSRAVFFTASALVYTAAIVSATLTLNPYFSQTWDVNAFIQAAHRFLDGGNPFDLYAQSRAAQTWPYAYPPLHAFVVALALWVGSVVRVLPEYVWARVPVIVADIGAAIVLYRIVLRKSNDETSARTATLVWLFNPITFYDTAVQGHFESEWLLFVLLAYAWLEESRRVALPTLALAIAVLFKQIAIVFAIPMFVSFLVGWLDSWRVGWLDGRLVGAARSANLPTSKPTNTLTNRSTNQLTNLLLSLALFAFVVGAVCLPFLLYSDDFLFMNLTYVENVPVQTSSWIVALLGVTRAAPDALTSDFFLLRYQTLVTILAVVAITFIAVRRGWSLYLTGALIAIAFFLTSKKVMGYYYIMLLPFLLAEILPRRRVALALTALGALAYLSLSPYYAAWTNHAHWWAYAILGTMNSLFFVWLFWQTIADRRPPTTDQNEEPAVSGQRSAVLVALGLFASAMFAAWLQPWLPNNGSPIRAPMVPAGMEASALIVFAVLIALVVLASFVVRAIAQPPARATIAVWGIALVFAPLFFSVYTLTKESTALFELALKMLGV